MLNAFTRVEKVGTADQFVEFPNAELCHERACFFCDKEKEVDDMFRLAAKFLAQNRILRGNADRAGIQMTFAHHDAARNHKRCGSKTEFICTEQGADNDIASGLHLTVSLHDYTAAQTVQHQGLLRFGKAKFPRRAGVLDR